MKPERISEYARMVLGPVRYADKETRSQTIHTLHAMLNEEFNALKREERHKKIERPSDRGLIDASQKFDAVSLAKAGYLAPWKKTLARVLGL